MSKISTKAHYEAFMEWHKWATQNYQSMKVKKKKPTSPTYVSYEGNGN